MKIVTLSTKDTLGGAARVAYRLHEAYKAKGVDEMLLVSAKQSADASVVRFVEYHKPKGMLGQMAEAVYHKLRERKRLRKWNKYKNRKDVVFTDLEISLLGDTLHKIDFNVLHLHWVGECYVNFTEFRDIDKPVVWTLHDCFAFTGICSYFETCNKYQTHCGDCPLLQSGQEKDLSYKVFEQKLERYKNIDFHIVSPSRWLADRAKESALLGKYPIHVIPNGLDTNFFYPIPKESAKKALGINPDKTVFLFGGIAIDKDPRKGGRLLLEALHKFKKEQNRDDIEILLLGTKNNDIDYGFPATPLGYVTDERFIRIAYSAADLTLLPSMHENLPTTIMESMACGTPTVSFNIGGNGDMVDHKKNGYLAQPFDTDDFKDGIVWCLQNNEGSILERLAREKVLAEFRIEDIAQKYVDLYNSLAQK
ncbi:glycosyltransferase involved in cell wall biosynthesis [Dysgonomonas sp. PH5-45]|uniref:glycosyltransferase family 4 protein n=1 Tax=unclassified Dysgonomonas TaxID=2630389 RepID=UPI0024748FC2|nr:MULTISPECIES: glycosyltransferase family 4 protein [unclassified Dysgonomonas]MDH6355299.1 glycosyltransferase involved in cell wall biosynthesis [Dysgonomonas sp. PH5-45]MDH6388175.1 glycosyltransferase involved in cell wall biosynthesis [Dysgonomonas sp. PH5-37]